VHTREAAFERGKESVQVSDGKNERRSSRRKRTNCYVELLSRE
jgi:hypothetical protein